MVVSPNKITVLKESKPGQPMERVDSFFIASAEEVGNEGNEILLACDDCSTLQSCFDTDLKAKKPLPAKGTKVHSESVKATKSDEKPQHQLGEELPPKP